MATSAPSEKIFSTAGNVVNEKRSRLSSWNVNNFVFLHTNLYKGEKMTPASVGRENEYDEQSSCLNHCQLLNYHVFALTAQ